MCLQEELQCCGTSFLGAQDDSSRQSAAVLTRGPDVQVSLIPAGGLQKSNHGNKVTGTNTDSVQPQPQAL